MFKKWISKMPNFYAVARGFQAGVYRTWAECERNVSGYSGAKFKKFPTEQMALDFIKEFGKFLWNDLSK